MKWIDRVRCTPRHLASVGGIPAALVLGLWLAWDTTAFNLRAYLNHDIAWILDSTARLLDGGRFGVDILEPNPPLIWWLSAPIVLIANAMEWSPASVFIVCVAIMSVALLVGAAAVMWWAPAELRRIETGILLFLVAYVLFPASFRDFGQREYLALVLAAPYLIACTARLRQGRFSPLVAFPVGLLAGLGFALKPYFLIVPILIELYCLRRTRRAGFLWRPEMLGMAAVGLVYGLLLFVIFPDWYRNVVPLVSLTFGAFEKPFLVVGAEVLPSIIGLALVATVVLNGNASDLLVVLFLAAVGFGASYFAQMKGYTYHAYPFKALTILALGLIVAREFDDIARAVPRNARLLVNRSGYFVGLGLVLTASVAEWIPWRREARPNGTYHRQTTEIVEAVKIYPSFLSLSSHPYPGFPTALYSGSEWVARTNSRWLLPAVARFRENREEFPAHYGSHIESLAWRWLADDLRKRPALVLVDPSPSHHGMHGLRFDILQFYLEDSEVASLWAAYEETDRLLQGYRVFVHLGAVEH